MFYAKVVGFAHSTVKHSSMKGVRLLLCEQIDAETGAEAGNIMLAADWLGAGAGNTVMVTADGDAASRRIGDMHTPLRYVVLGIVDGKKEAV